MKRLACLLAFLAALSPPAAAEKRVVRVDGSSTVFPITEAVAEEFQKSARQGIRVTVGISGTGGGFRKFCRGETDVCDASRPILKAEMAECARAGVEYFELPVAFDALTVVVHPKNGFVDRLTLAEMKRMWEPAAQGRVLRWNQVNPAWPDRPLNLFGPGADSGTFDYFTEAVVGRPRGSRGDFTASENDNTLVQGVAGDVNALGYFGYAYYAENRDKLKAVAIVNAKGEPVLPSAQAVEEGRYAPLSRPMFIYVSARALERPEVRQFVEYYLRNAAQLAREVKYIPLPASAYATALEYLRTGRKGPVFGGAAAVGITVDELLRREARL